jgi:hypothetical protein
MPYPIRRPSGGQSLVKQGRGTLVHSNHSVIELAATVTTVWKELLNSTQ